MNGQNAMPPYPATWTETGRTYGRRTWVVYDQREGFTPAYALVWADDAGEAVEVASSLSGGRLDDDSETLVVFATKSVLEIDGGYVETFVAPDGENGIRYTESEGI